MVRAVAFISFLYDVGVGLALLVAAPSVASFFRTPIPEPAVLGDTNGLLLIAVGLGYLLPVLDPQKWRAYMWLMGPLLKGAGAIVFVRDAFLRGSPAGFLLFAISDGALAALTLFALMRNSRPPVATPPVEGGAEGTGIRESRQG